MTAAFRTKGEAGHHGEFTVPSNSEPGKTYRVIWLAPDSNHCPCPAYQYRARCRHTAAVAAAVETEAREQLEMARERIAGIKARLDRAMYQEIEA